MERKEIGLSERELVRHGVLERLRVGGLSEGDAARELGLSTRQVRRLLRRLESAGPAGLRSARRGRKPNNWIDAGRREVTVALLGERYRDFGLTLACQMLAERHGQVFSVETTRTLMREAGLWRPKRRSVCFHPRPGERGWGNWCKLTAQRTTGSKAGHRAAPCWSLSTMRPAAFRRRALWALKRRLPTWNWWVSTLAGMACRKPSTATGTASFGSMPPSRRNRR